MQLSLPEHRLQELKARSIMHTSWIFIPAIISLSLLASEVHRCHRHAEGGFLWRFLLPQLTWKVHYERCFGHSLYIHAERWCHESTGITAQDVPSFISIPPLLSPLPPPPFLCPPTLLPHFWTSNESDIYPYCHCCSRFLTHRNHSKAIPYRAYWKTKLTVPLLPHFLSFLTPRSCHFDFVKHEICYF